MNFLKMNMSDVWATAAVFVLFWSVFEGFTGGSQPSAVAFGCLSSIFWIFASLVPMYWEKLKEDTDTINGLNAFAAASTGASVLASVPHAWKVLFG